MGWLLKRVSFYALIIIGVATIYNPVTSLASESGSEDITSYDSLITTAKKSMMINPNEALKSAQKAEEMLDKSTRTNEKLAVSLWLQSEALNRMNRPNDSAPILKRALALPSFTNLQLKGDLLLTQGRLSRTLGQDDVALISFQSAFQEFSKISSERSQAIALQSLGTLYDDARQYERVIDYYEQASAVFSDDAMLDLVSLNNRANAYRELEEYATAKALSEKALVIAKSLSSDMLQARILTNIAILEIRAGDLDSAEKSISDGLRLTQSESAKGWEPFLWGAKAELDLARGELTEAQKSLRKTFAEADLLETSAPFRDFHETAYKVFSQLNNEGMALSHLAAFKRLDDKGRDVAASANLAILNAEFELTNKRLEIQNLRSTQLESDIALSRAKERQQLIVFVALLVVSFGIVTFLLWSNRISRKTQRVTHELNCKLEEQNKALEESNTKLIEANEAKIEFLATTSHEIRTPLNAINGFTGLIMSSEKLDSENQEYIRLANSAGKNLLKIVNDILDISKLEADRLEPNYTEVSISETVMDVAELWRSSAETKGLQFTVEVDPAIGIVNTDDRLIRQILSNLISNAIKFTSSGQVGIQLLTQMDETFQIEVRDTGIGIPDNMHNRVFESFRQVDSRRNRDYEGTGLGLAICHKLAAVLGGSIELHSSPENGSTFTVLMPINIDVTKTVDPLIVERQVAC